MADRKRKLAHQAEQEDTEEHSETSLDVQAMMRLMLEENKRAEARRESEAKRAVADKLAEEKRAEARQIAVEERAEVRRREEKIAEEERIEARRVAAEEKAEERAEAKRVAEARALKEFEAVREEAACVASIKLAEQQEAASRRAYEQQVELMRMQAELGENAAKVHREEQAAERRRDKAISSIPNFKEGDDVEEFLLTAEKRLGVGGIKEDEWVAVLAFKLSGKLGSVWQDISATVEDYREVKNRVLKVCGHTPKLAAEIFFGFKSEQSGGLTADQLYYRGKQLFRRMVAPHRDGEEAEFTILRGWISAVVPRKARVALDARVVNNAVELVDALQDYLIMEGDRTEGQAAVFKKSQGSEGSREKVSPLTCFKCGKQGHKAFECWGGENSFYQPAVGSSSTPGKISCYSCGEEGHKSTQCPNKNRIVKTEPNLMKQVKAEPKEVPSKPMRRIWRHQNHDTVLKMRVNSQEASVLLDSGSCITVVPETMVAQAQKTGETVAIRAFGAKEMLVLPMAEVPFEVDTLSWMEPVALAPVEAGCEQEVVYGLNLVSKRGMELVFLANKGNQANVRRLTAWAQSKDVSQEEEKEAGVVAAVSGRKSSEESTGDGKPVEDRPAGVPEPVVNEEALGGQRSEVGFLVKKEEEYYVEALSVELQSREKPLRLRRLTVIRNLEMEEEGSEMGGACATPAISSGELDSSRTASGVVGRTREELEACHYPMCDVCINLLSPLKSTSSNKDGVQPCRANSGEKEPKMQQSRSTGFISVGGDVGTAHIEKTREGGANPHRRRKKNLEEDKVQRAHDSVD